MWHSIIPPAYQAMAEFEKAFGFRLDADLRQFWKDHNGGKVVGSTFPTTVQERSLRQLFNVGDRYSPRGAWMVNSRLRPILTTSRIAFGCDIGGNLLCVEKSGNKQTIVLWNHITASFEPCLLDIPGFLKAIS